MMSLHLFELMQGMPLRRKLLLQLGASAGAVYP